ncbi:hypothetical protein GGF46_000931 [Coemansia sp. RSA 552]|nr:hypothetical protein GGF46_000931 [Coemansia sp. RSA 552]
MSEAAYSFLAAVERLPRERYPATLAANAVLGKLVQVLVKRLPPHLHPLMARLQAYCVRKVFAVEGRVHINPTFRLLLSTRIIPPGLAFAAAAASTVYVLRYLYVNALDLLTNLVGVAYPAYQSIMCIEYGDLSPETVYPPECGGAGTAAGGGNSLDQALGISQPNLDKKQWLMYWSIFGILTTADHWAGPILRLFPLYRPAKIAVLLWAQHRQYNGASWLYDTFIQPLLPPPASLKQASPSTHHLDKTRQRTDTNTMDDNAAADAAGNRPRVSFASLVAPSVWASAAAGPDLPAVQTK